jgi:hypothetical protein
MRMLMEKLSRLTRSKLFVFKIGRCNQFEIGIAEKIRIFAVIETPFEFLSACAT